MLTFRLAQEVAGSQEAVFAAIADVTSGATWSPLVSGARREDSGPVGLGSRYRLSTYGAGRQSVEVAAFEPPALVTLRVGSALVDVDHTYRLERGPGDRTVVRHEVRATFSRMGILASPVLAPALWVLLRLEARQLGRHLALR